MFSQKNKQGWRNPWVLGLIAVILSGVLINARMLWNVLHFPTRLLDDNYSVKAHNQYDAKWVQQQAERSTLGWQARIHSPQQLQNDSQAVPSAVRFILLASPAVLKLTLNDRDGKPVQGGQVEINAQWPGNPAFDFKSVLYEAAPGNYEGSLKFSRAGNWDLLIRAQLDDRQFDMEQKVFVAVPK
ncbi:MAG: FixH family protein [Gallionella sp.]